MSANNVFETILSVSIFFVLDQNAELEFNEHPDKNKKN